MPEGRTLRGIPGRPGRLSFGWLPNAATELNCMQHIATSSLGFLKHLLKHIYIYYYLISIYFYHLHHPKNITNFFMICPGATAVAVRRVRAASPRTRRWAAPETDEPPAKRAPEICRNLLKSADLLEPIDAGDLWWPMVTYGDLWWPMVIYGDLFGKISMVDVIATMPTVVVNFIFAYRKHRVWHKFQSDMVTCLG